jgi:undecaprenyl-diphosphatase
VGHLNLELFRAVNGSPDSLRPFLTFWSVATNLLWVKIALGALIVGMVWRPGNARQAAIRALIAVGIANTMTDQFKRYDGMLRPCIELADWVYHGVGCGNPMGTASAHSANMAAVALVFVIYLRWWGAPWVVVALLTGLSRVYVGAHYPYQVLLGFLCGIVGALGPALLFRTKTDGNATEEAHEACGEADGETR